MSVGRRLVSDPAFVAFGRCLVGVVLLWAGLGKLRKPGAFVSVVHDYRMVPSWLRKPVGYTTPPIELFLGAALLSGLFPTPVSIAAGSFLALASVAVGTNIVRGDRDVNCGCFGQRSSARLTWTLVGRNAALVVMSLLVAFGSSRQPAWSPTPHLASLPDVLAYAGAICFLAVAYLIGRLLDLHRLSAKHAGSRLIPDGLPVGRGRLAAEKLSERIPVLTARERA